MESTKSHSELRAELIDKAVIDDEFRSHLVEDPKSAIKDALGIELPEAVNIHVHEDTEMSAHLVLPPMASLDEGDLEAVAGGHLQTAGMYGGSRIVPHSH